MTSPSLFRKTKVNGLSKKTDVFDKPGQNRFLNRRTLGFPENFSPRVGLEDRRNFAHGGPGIPGPKRRVVGRAASDISDSIGDRNLWHAQNWAASIGVPRCAICARNAAVVSASVPVSMSMPMPVPMPGAGIDIGIDIVHVSELRNTETRNSKVRRAQIILSRHAARCGYGCAYVCM